MSGYRELDIDNIARIGLMYLDGDKFETVLTDKFCTDYDDVNYNHEYFNELKIALLKAQRINPDFAIAAFLWQLRLDNANMVVPVISGDELPDVPWERYWTIQAVNEKMEIVFNTGVSQYFARENDYCSYYYALRNSDEEIVGVLELVPVDSKHKC